MASCNQSKKSTFCGKTEKGNHRKELLKHNETFQLQLKLIHLFASELLLMKELEIEKTKPTFIISVLKVEN